MSFLNELFAELNNDDRELLQERLDIVEHKIKFMDKIPVACLNLDNTTNYHLSEEILLAGGMNEPDILNAVYIVYHQEGKTLIDLMREVPTLLNPDWQAVKNNRIILLSDSDGLERNAQRVINMVEDIAEMIHPGYFIFGGEGDKWIRFSL
ncbi:ABC transporter substrate-binding protein [Pedobacter changchengzhani]|uniref:ABC transporter substrate-binding protein n=1 Tax=Pedobacter changchengzhani TaxID=2529274 RepID=A0A4R5MI16_9SPHI|nr:ABC transporter substrate-binding protein [Pedobacter changchengzhani]TDG35151.1 ABC transporter substrate-binding protein [Pedobacter changchengzhani]